LKNLAINITLGQKNVKQTSIRFVKYWMMEFN